MAGGNGTRLRPTLASPINKHLIPVGGKPLIFWPLELLARSGITDVLVMLNGAHPELLLETVDNGNHFGLEVTYSYTKETYGPSVGMHILRARSWVKDEPFLLMLGDSVFFLDTIPDINSASPTHCWAMPIENGWDDPRKYAKLPGLPGYCQTGLWLFDSKIFNAIEELSSLEELRVRNLVEYLHKNQPVNHTIIGPQQFIDCGTPKAIKKVDYLNR